MAFWLYSKNQHQYQRLSPIKLTGKGGLLATFLHKHAGEDTPYAWELTPAELIAFIDPTLDPTAHEVVIDMLPESFTEVSLYRVTSLRGVSEFDETDLVLACRILFQGRTKVPSDSFKQAFCVEDCPSDRQMVEAFRLTGGIASGKYLWAKPKMDIGAAICPAKSK